MEVRVDAVSGPLYLPAEVVEPDLITDDDVDDDDLTGHADAVLPVGDSGHGSPIPVELDVERLVSHRQGV